MQKLTKKDILNIKPGAVKVFVLDTAKAVVSARQYAYQLAKVEPRSGIERYKTIADYKNCTIAIEAIASKN